MCTVRLNVDECWERLGASGHGVLATVHPERGVDAVPVVYVEAQRNLILPIDTVKAKTTVRLQRLTNLELDPRCVLLVEHWDREDWFKLWWVRVHGTATPTDAVYQELDRFEQYRQPGAVVGNLRLTPTEITGWTA